MTFLTPHISHSRHGLFFTRWIVNPMLNLLKRTMTYPGFEPGTFGLAVSIAHHYTIWVDTLLKIWKSQQILTNIQTKPPFIRVESGHLIKFWLRATACKKCKTKIVTIFYWAETRTKFFLVYIKNTI
jgi:hypothetical protein